MNTDLSSATCLRAMACLLHTAVCFCRDIVHANVSGLDWVLWLLIHSFVLLPITLSCLSYTVIICCFVKGLRYA